MSLIDRISKGLFGLELKPNHSIKSRYYIYLMDLMQNVIFVTSYYVYSKLLTILFRNFLMLIESRHLLKNHVSCNLC